MTVVVDYVSPNKRIFYSLHIFILKFTFNLNNLTVQYRQTNTRMQYFKESAEYHSLRLPLFYN